MILEPFQASLRDRRSVSARVAATTLLGIVGVAATLGRAETPLTTVRIVRGLSNPIWVGHAPGDASRLFVIEQAGRVRIVKNGSLLPTPFLDLAADGLIKCCNEQGLLGLAFHPNYATNGRFFLNYTRAPDGTTVLARHTVSSDPDIANEHEEVLLSVGQPFSNHNGGWIEFGRDGYLYVALGDGGDRDDPGDRAQNITNELLGKILRIDVNSDDFPDDPDRNYAIPPDNPFVGIAGLDEIWAYGLRNPWRNSFDPATGDLYIADVGQDRWEEINVQPGGSPGGANYGWRCREGLHCNPAFDCSCDQPSFVSPIHEYAHGGTPFRCSITGGEVYRGCAIPDLSGTYFFSDYCSFQIWSLRFDGVQAVDVRERTDELAPAGSQNIRRVSSFGRDALGELYLCDRVDGEIFKIVPASPQAVAIVSSDPADGAIDARQPLESDGLSVAGWRSVDLTFEGALPSCSDALSFLVSREGSPGPAPAITGVEVLAPNRLRILLDRPIPVAAWTRITHIPSAQSVRVGFLPGDVNGSRTTTPADVLDLINALNGAVARDGDETTDIDRNGAVDAADVARLIELLDGFGSFAPFLGATLP